MSHRVRAFAPATVANLAAGFDVLGLAVDAPGDVVHARFGGAGGVTLREISGDAGRLPLEATLNTAGIAAIGTLARAGVTADVELVVEKGLPIGSGLGSSAASAAAAAVAVNALIGKPLRKADLIGPCLEAEAAVSGRHADNIAPALLGGLVLVRSLDPVPDVVRLPIPESLRVATVTPDFALPTRAAREALPSAVSLADMVANSANLGGLVAACFSGDLALLGRCVTDRVVTPARSALIPGCDDVMRAALDAGALGTSISGAGPTVFALCRSDRGAARVAERMVAAFAGAGLASAAHVSPVDCPGARVL